MPYGLSSIDLYKNFNFINFSNTNKKTNVLNEKKNVFARKFANRLNNLNIILKKNNITPIFITQIEYDGLRNEKLFLINEETKKFAKNNNYMLVPLDEIAEMSKGDFYDRIHTTPQGSKKIAKLIYPYLKNFLISN